MRTNLVSLRGAKGDKGDQGNQGLPGVNAVSNDNAMATLVTTPASATGTAVDKKFTKPGAPQALMGLTVDGKRNTTATDVLRPFWASLAGRGVAKSQVAVIGDSIARGGVTSAPENDWVDRMAEGMRLRYPVAGVRGGRGFLGVEGHALVDGWRIQWNGDAAVVEAGWGPNRTVLGLGNPGSGTTYYFPRGTAVDVMYLTAPGAGIFSYSVDGGTAVQINTNQASADGRLTRINLGASGAHTVKFTAVSGPSYIDGVIHYDGDENKGFRAHALGHGGWTATDWAAGPHDITRWPGALAALQPDLILVALGTNDMAQNVPVATFKTKMIEVLANQIRPILWQTPIALVTYGRGLNLTDYPAYMQAAYEISEAIGNSIVIDLSLRLPSYANSYGTFQDALHPNDRGHQMIADLVISAISPQ